MSSIYNFEKFLTCEGNMIAFNAAKEVAKSPTTAYNPLYIYGGHGTGKTHLLKAIENAISENHPKMNVLYVTTEKFINDILEAIKCGEGSQIIISSDKPPKKLDVDEHMRSKLGMGLIAELKAPDTLMKNNLVRLKAGERGVLLHDDVVEFISLNIGSNISEIEGAITSIVAYSELSRPVITLDIAKNILKDVVTIR